MLNSNNPQDRNKMKKQVVRNVKFLNRHTEKKSKRMDSNASCFFTPMQGIREINTNTKTNHYMSKEEHLGGNNGISFPRLKC